MNRQMTFGNRLFLSVTVLGAFLLAVSGIGVYGMFELDQVQEDALIRQARKIQLLAELTTSGEEWLANQRGLIMGALLKEDDKAREARQQSDDRAKKIEQDLNELEPLLQLASSRQVVEKMRGMGRDLARQQPQLFELLGAHKVNEAVAFQDSRMRPVFEAFHTEAKRLFGVQGQLMKDLRAQSESRSALWRWLILVAGVVSAAVCLIVVWIVRKANTDLRRLASQIAQGAQQVASAAGQVSSSSQSQAQGASEQSAALEETSSSTEEISSMTQKNSENSRLAADETANADQLLKETNSKLGQMIESMREINLSSEKISKIIKVIDEIAFQTNILALNAAVEAARAGEAGMGFAVVADEVRNLAQRCAQAAKDTSELIEESIGRSNEGKLRLDEVAGCVTRVVENASRIRVLANEVHVGSQEQSRGIEQIAKAISQMQQVTQSSAASAEEGASAGEEMSSQAAHLSDSAARLHEMVGSDDDNREVRPAPALKAVAHAATRVPAVKPQAQPYKAPALNAPKPAKDAFPLDDDFKDF